jgi:hypothetical protein
MPNELYKLILDRKIKDGAQLNHVKKQLVELFKTDVARIDALFVNAPVVIKRGLKQAEALKYKQAIEQTGARCRVEQEETQPTELSKPEKNALSPSPNPSPQGRGISASLPSSTPKKLIACPKCGFEQEAGRTECLRCGIIFAKFQAAVETDARSPIRQGGRLPQMFGAEEEQEASQPEASEEIGVRRIEREGWVALGIGLVITVIILIIPFLRFIFGYIKVLVHEFGHAVFDWLFGYPSIPAFDFMYGGGIAIKQDRQIILVVLVYVGLAWLGYVYRRNRLTLVVLGLIMLIYSLFAWTDLHDILILFMGHGTELVFAWLCLYRAISGRSILVAAERPLYAFVGFFIEFLDLGFAYQLMTSYGYRVDYEEAKGGGHWMDFSRIAEEFLHVNVTAVAGFFLVCCLIVPVLAFLFFRYEAYIFSFLGKVLRTESEE